MSRAAAHVAEWNRLVQAGELPDDVRVRAYLFGRWSYIDAQAERIAAVEAPLRWTTEVPTEAGWYWHRDNSPRFGYGPLETMQIDWVSLFEGGELFLGERESGELVEEIEGEWAGPIPTPSEAT